MVKYTFYLLSLFSLFWENLFIKNVFRENRGTVCGKLLYTSSYEYVQYRPNV